VPAGDEAQSSVHCCPCRADAQSADPPRNHSFRTPRPQALLVGAVQVTVVLLELAVRRDVCEAGVSADGVYCGGLYTLHDGVGVLERDLIAAAQEADVGLIPYKTDRLNHRFACPNKLSQYLHAGLAILSNRIAFVEQVVREGNLGLCYDIELAGSFLAAVQRLASDRGAVDEFKKNGLAYGEREYNWERFEGVLLSVVAEAQLQQR